MPLELDYYTVDVFTDQQFGGNPLAVVVCPITQTLSTQHMQNIAREFNYSETAFLLPPPSPHSSDDVIDATATLRIFTVGMELPFAGHPNVGAAFVVGKLAGAGKKLFGKDITITDGCVVFIEGAGVVRCQLNSDDDVVTIIAPHTYTPVDKCVGLSAQQVAECLNLSAHEVIALTMGGCGLPFVLAQVSTTCVLRKCSPHTENFRQLQQYLNGEGLGIHVYCICSDVDDHDDFDVRARMFFPDLGVVLEDPATGSANCALLGHLGSTHHSLVQHSKVVKIAQGVEMGRASCLYGQYLSESGQVKISGSVVEVMSGKLCLK